MTFDNACNLTGFSVSFVNNLRDPVRDVFALVSFYDSSNQPLDTVTAQVKDVIMPGLAKRIRGSVDESVGRMVTGQRGNCLPPPPILPQTRADILVLDFKIVQ